MWANLFLLFCSNINSLYAQDNLTGLLQQLQTTLKTVEIKDGTIEQQVEWYEGEPFLLKYTASITNEKGDKNTVELELNIASIHSSSITSENKKEQILVTGNIRNKKKYIKVFEDRKQKKYINEIVLVAEDNDNASAIKDLLKKIVPLAEEAMSQKKRNIDSYEEQLKWLNENISELTIGEKQFNQSFRQNKDVPYLVEYSREKNDGKKEDREEFKFNLGDLDAESIEMKVKGMELQIEAKTVEKLKYIQVFENGEQKKYTNSFKIFAKSVEDGDQIVELLKLSIQEARKLRKEPVVNDVKHNLKLISNAVNDVVISDKKIKQSFKENCITTYVKSSSGGKKTKEEIMVYDLGDLNRNEVKIKVAGTAVFLEMKSNQKYIESIEEEDRKFGNKVKLVASDIENAKHLAYLLPKAIEGCQTNRKSIVPEGDKTQQWNWLIKKMKEANMLEEEYQQSLEKMDNKDCKWRLNISNGSGKKVKEECFEFNLKDMEASSVELKISSDDLWINYQTIGKEKVIKYLEDGTPDDYQNKVRIKSYNIEAAKGMMGVLKELTKQCQTKE